MIKSKIKFKSNMLNEFGHDLKKTLETNYIL